MSQPPIDAQITFLYTKSMDKTAPFYENVLGFKLTLDQGSCRIYHITGQKAYLGICERDYAPDKPEGVIFTIVTDDVDGWYNKLQGNGVKCDDAPRTTHAYGIYHFFFNDPNGYLFEVQRFLNENWNQSQT